MPLDAWICNEDFATSINNLIHPIVKVKSSCCDVSSGTNRDIKYTSVFVIRFEIMIIHILNDTLWIS